jgi:hypothetical protein
MSDGIGGRKLHLISIATKLEMIEWLRDNMSQQRIDAEKLNLADLAALLRKVLKEDRINNCHVESVLIDSGLALKPYAPQRSSNSTTLTQLAERISQQDTTILELLDRVNDLESRLNAMRVISAA